MTTQMRIDIHAHYRPDDFDERIAFLDRLDRFLAPAKASAVSPRKAG